MPADQKPAADAGPTLPPASHLTGNVPLIDRVPPGLAAEVVAWFHTAGFVRLPTEQQVRNIAHFIHIATAARANAVPWKRAPEVQRLSDGLDILRQAMPACLALADAAEARHKAEVERNGLPSEWSEDFDRKVQVLQTLASAVEVAAPDFCRRKHPGRPAPAGKCTALVAASLIKAAAQAAGNAPPKFTADGPGTKTLHLLLYRIEGAPAS